MSPSLYFHIHIQVLMGGYNKVFKFWKGYTIFQSPCECIVDCKAPFIIEGPQLKHRQLCSLVDTKQWSLVGITFFPSLVPRIYHSIDSIFRASWLRLNLVPFLLKCNLLEDCRCPRSLDIFHLIQLYLLTNLNQEGTLMCGPVHLPNHSIYI